jgi:chemotaxis protein methyltransferase CheR
VQRLTTRGESEKARMRQLGGQGGEGTSLAALTCLALVQDRAALGLAIALVERGVEASRVAKQLAPFGPHVLREVEALSRVGAAPAAKALFQELCALLGPPTPAPPASVHRGAAALRASTPALASAFGKRSSRRPPSPVTIFDLPRLSPEDFRSLQGLVRASSGIVLQDDARASVERKLGERVMALGLQGFRPYLEHLRHDPAAATEVERVIDIVAVHETYFFRESPQLFAFQQEVLPALRERLGPRGSLTLWSAGCSTGEEAYSLAMLVAHTGLFMDATVRVIGNDISRRVIQTARRGVYRGGSFRALPAEYARYFVDVEGGRKVRDDIRSLCHFTRLNLLDGSRAAIVGRVNAVFCRNLLIYFDEQARGELVQAFHERLLPGGFLMLGHSESLLHVTTAFELHQLSTDLVYRKPAVPGRP